MAQTPDTFVVTAPQNIAVSIDDVLVTPTGGSQGRLADKIVSGGTGTVTQVVAGAGLAGGTIATTGTISLGTIAAGDLMGNSGTAGAVPAGIAVGSGLTLSVAGTLSATGGSVTSVIAQGGPFLANGTITGAGTISNSTASLTAHGIIIAEGTAAAVATAAMTDGQLLIGATGADPAPQTVSGDATITKAGVIAVSKVAGNTLSANAGAVMNAGTVQVNNVTTLTGTAAGTLTLAATTGTSDIVIAMPASGGTVTLAAAPSFKRQRYEVDVVQGATAGVLTLNTGFVFGTSGGPTGYTATATAAAVDRLMMISPDGTKLAVLAVAQGFTI